MTLTGNYAKRATKSYKTVEGKRFLSMVRQALRLMDQVMKGPSTHQRGEAIAQIMSELEMAADAYDLYGEKDRRKQARALGQGE